MTILRRIPAWAYLLALLTVALYVQDWRSDRKIAALSAQIEAAKVEAIAQARESVVKEMGALKAGRVAEAASVRAAQARVAELERRLAAIDAGIAKGRQDATTLIERGTVDEVVNFGKALGYSPIPMARPR